MWQELQLSGGVRSGANYEVRAAIAWESELGSEMVTTNQD